MCILKKIIIYKCIFKSIFYNNKKKHVIFCILFIIKLLPQIVHA